MTENPKCMCYSLDKNIVLSRIAHPLLHHSVTHAQSIAVKTSDLGQIV